AGATLLGFGFLIIFIYLAIALKWGSRSESNPWRSKGFEWLTASPPPTHNFEEIPTITQMPHDYRTHEPGGVIRVACSRRAGTAARDPRPSLLVARAAERGHAAGNWAVPGHRGPSLRLPLHWLRS